MNAEDNAARVLDAALNHVAFDGWGDATFQAAVADSGVDPGLARALFPRAGLDLALAYHRRGDAQMAAILAQSDLSELRFRDRIAKAIRTRLELIEDPEAVRRGTTLFALPQNASDGAKAIWGTADVIWNALGDKSDDINWYSKRTTLSAVYSSTVLYWLGDDSADKQATWEFLDRRIENVMQFEKVKAAVEKNPLAKFLLSGPRKLLGQVRKPNAASNLPGRAKD